MELPGVSPSLFRLLMSKSTDPYEEPLHPEVVVETDRESIPISAIKILNELEGRKLLDGSRSFQ